MLGTCVCNELSEISQDAGVPLGRGPGIAVAGHAYTVGELDHSASTSTLGDLHLVDTTWARDYL